MKYTLHVLLVGMLLFSIYSYAGLVRERKQVMNLTLEVGALEERVNELEGDLAVSNRKIASVENRLENLEELFNETIVEQNAEIGTLRGELESIKTDMNYYFDWFKANSNLDVPDTRVRDLRDSIDPCISSVVSLACIGFMNSDYLHLSYFEDTEAGRVDFIQNVTCTLRRGGGDCEDFATLFMAELNYAKNRADYFEAWKPGEGTYKLYGDWYLRNAEPVLLSGRNVYVVCYSSTGAGHCLNAICEEDAVSRLKSTRNIDRALSTCVFVEPQDYGIVREVLHEGNVTFIGDDPLVGWLLIMDSSDLCLLSRTEGTWKCFSDVASEIERVLNNTSD